MIEAGETSTGLLVLEAGGAGGKRLNAASATNVDQALLVASTKLALGKYSEAVEALVTAETIENKDKTQTLETNLIRLKHCLRTNQYEALFAVSSAIKNNFSGNRDAQLERALIENTAARDLLDYDKIEESVLEIQVFDNLDFSDDLRCSLSRSLARSYAKLGNLKYAKEHSTRALELSQKLDHVRALGNSLFAEGEVLRYGSDNDGAIEFYDKAIRLAQGTNNRDAWLWALLAKGFAHLGQSKATKAEIVREKLEELLKEEGFSHPLEQLHTSLLGLLAKPEFEQSEVDELVSKYGELGLAWPKEAIPRLLENGVTAAVPI